MRWRLGWFQHRLPVFPAETAQQRLLLRGSLLAAEWRFVVLGGRLVVLVVNGR